MYEKADFICISFINGGRMPDESIYWKANVQFLGNDYLFPTSFAQYDQFLKEHKVITGTPEAAMITKVGKRIATAAERWLNANG